MPRGETRCVQLSITILLVEPNFVVGCRLSLAFLGNITRFHDTRQYPPVNLFIVPLHKNLRVILEIILITQASSRKAYI
jgi:hypothetical protein